MVMAVRLYQKLPLSACRRPPVALFRVSFSSRGDGKKGEDPVRGAMNAYMDNVVRPATDSKPWDKLLKEKTAHKQYFAVDDPNREGEEDAGSDGVYKERRSRRGRRRRDEDEDDSDRSFDKNSPKGVDNSESTRGISPTVLNMMDDWTHFEELGRKGHTVDTSDMDDFDAFLSLIYAESAKTSDGSVWGTMEEGLNERGKGGKRSKVRIPHPRTTRQLVRTTVPQICPIEGGEAESEGVALAMEAWKVLAKNPYYTLQEKKDLCNRIARRANWYLDENRGNIYDEDLEDSKQPTANKNKWSKVLDPDWTRGLPGIEAEEELAQKLEDEAMMKRTKDYIGQDDTNWDVEAVVDEDDLFK